MKAERDAVFSALKSSGKQAHATSDFCTTRRLRDVLTAGCRILHCSGHGFSYLDQSGRQQSRLAFEDGEGGTHALEVSNLLALIWAGAEGDERPPLDLAFVSAALESREIYIEVGLDTQYLLARMRTPTQVLEAETFEESKGRVSGLHFLSVQNGPEAEQPDGFWLLRDTEAASKAKR